MVLSEIDNQLIAKGLIYIDDQGKKCYSQMETPEKGIKIRNFISQENAVMVVGYPKTGSHLIMSILEELGIDKIVKHGEKSVTGMPFEYQPSVESFEILEKRLTANSNLLTLPICHSPPSHFPLNFVGKIIFIDRDPRAVVVSGYNFFPKTPFKAYMDLLELNDVNKFAQHVFEGKFIFGKINEFAEQWKAFAAQNPKISILFLKYEEILEDKVTYITKIAEYLGVKDYNLDEVITNTSIEKTRERAQEKLVKAGQNPGFVNVIYRAGKANSWKECLSADVLQLYESSL